MESVLALLRTVVEPAVSAVLKSGEVTSLELFEADQGGFKLRVVAVGETYEDWVVQAGIEGMTVEDCRERLRSNLVDFVAESGFGWGQNREDGPPT